MRIRVT